MNKETTKKYDSDFCGSLPIHYINVIQDYGVLIAIERSSGLIRQVSENCSDLFNTPARDIVERPAIDFLPFAELLKQKARLPQEIIVGNKKFQGIYHEYESYYLVEINLHSENDQTSTSFIDVYHELKEAMAAMEACQSIPAILEVAARELKRASGFDKVMIYRFDENWNGHVLAEEREPDMEAYLGLTFPASDIPKQARDLYLKNAYRFIPDRTYSPVKMFPVINPTINAFLDMSDCNVRGVTTVHLEYLKNMGVTTSMSTRIIKDNKLWGLIACHHKTPMRMNFKVCTIFELLSGIISAKTATLQSQESHNFNTSLSGIYTSLIEETYRSSNLVSSLLEEDLNILQLFNAEGAVISYNGLTSRKGSVPESHDIEDIILWLNSKSADNVYFTNSLSRDYDYAAEFKDIASGMLAIPVNGTKDEYILLFRPEVIHEINWGGDPSTRLNFESDMKTYHPRSSFKQYQETVTGISHPWLKAEVDIAENLKEFVKAFLNGKDYAYKN